MLRCPFSPKLVYSFNAISIKIPAELPYRNWQTDSKIHMEMERIQIEQAKKTFEKEQHMRTNTA